MSEISNERLRSLAAREPQDIEEGWANLIQNLAQELFASRLPAEQQATELEQSGRPCSVCGAVTEWLCSDCAISRRGKVPLCSKVSCREAHEAFNPDELAHQVKMSETPPEQAVSEQDESPELGSNDGFPDYVQRYAMGRDAEGFSTGTLIPCDTGQWISSVSAHRLYRELRQQAALVKTLDFSDKEVEWLTSVATMEIKPNPPYGNYHITAAQKALAALKQAGAR